MSSAITKSDSKTSLLKCGAARGDFHVGDAPRRRSRREDRDSDAERGQWSDAADEQPLAGGSTEEAGPAGGGKPSRKRGTGGKSQAAGERGKRAAGDKVARCKEGALERSGSECSLLSGSASPSSSKSSKASLAAVAVDPGLSPMLHSVFGQECQPLRIPTLCPLDEHKPVLIEGSAVERGGKNFKFLGINSSEDQSWDVHVSAITKKVLQWLYFVRSLMRYATSPKTCKFLQIVLWSAFHWLNHCLIWRCQCTGQKHDTESCELTQPHHGHQLSLH
ncbi:calcium-binding protein 1a isoform X3 [Narcine bancroftii]|uniref:calcium-binding protein 1a isoform X3 n=1 Tax=Narcine bancroftii TaxID=1343680 RepID=UPI003831708A